MSDIAAMFGVTRQRICQLAQRGRVRTNGRGAKGIGLGAVRVWDDAAHRFRPVAKDVLAKRRAEKREVVALRRRVRAGYIEHARTALRELGKAARGRPLSLSEMWVAVSGQHVLGEAAATRLRSALGIADRQYRHLPLALARLGVEMLPVGRRTPEGEARRLAGYARARAA
jgi:hypothetical protein